MTGTIYLLRHGQADSAAAGRGQWQRGMEEQYDRLTRVGHRQARLVAAELQRRLKGGAALVSGPLRRQRDTLAPLAESLDIDPAVMEGWCEFNSDSVVMPYLDEHPEERDRLAEVYRQAADGGDGEMLVEGHRLLGAVLDRALDRWVEAPEFQDFRREVLGAFAAVVELARERDVVVATSGGPISVIVSSLFGSNFRHLIGRTYTASLTVLRVLPERSGANADGWAGGARQLEVAPFDGAGRGVDGLTPVRLVSYNEHSHLFDGAERLLHLR